MGYSISVPLKSKGAHAECLAFLRANYRPWTSIKPVVPDDVMQLVFDADPDLDWTRHLCTDGEFGYDHGKNRVGFNCSMSGGFVGEYASALLRFCALRWGRVRKLKKYTGSDESVPYTVYDGHEAWPVLLHHAWHDRVPRGGRWCLSNELGFKPLHRPWHGPWDPDDVPVAVVHHPLLLLPDGVKAALVKLGATPEAVSECSDGRIESTNPLVVEEVASLFHGAGLAHHVEHGPLVLDGWRKEMADREEATYVAVGEAISREMARLAGCLGVQPEDPTT